jgi:hypothetical protein
MTDQPLSRRAFLGRATVATAAAGMGLALVASPAAAADTVDTYALDPVGGGSSCRGGTGKGTCAACGACRQHAANKVFRTKEASDTARAHKGCRCEIVAGPVLETSVADAVFAKGDVADKRDGETGGLIDGGGGVTVPVMAATLPVIAIGGGALAYFLMRRHDRKVAPAELDQGDWR